jgi:hypothetical protein
MNPVQSLAATMFPAAPAAAHDAARLLAFRSQPVDTVGSEVLTNWFVVIEEPPVTYTDLVLVGLLGDIIQLAGVGLSASGVGVVGGHLEGSLPAVERRPHEYRRIGIQKAD